MSHPAGGVLAAALNGDLAPSHSVDRSIDNRTALFLLVYGQFARRRLAFDTGRARVGKGQRLVS